MTWAWEYEPDEPYVPAAAPPVLVVRVENKAAELVRAAEAPHLRGEAYEGLSPQGGTALVADGMFVYQFVPRHERVHILQTTGW
ncbi:hypothetical protein [Embleya sp. NPDC001921]